MELEQKFNLLMEACLESIKQSNERGWDENLLRVAIEKINGTYEESTPQYPTDK